MHDHIMALEWLGSIEKAALQRHVISCSVAFTRSVASLTNTLCPTSRRGRPFRRRLLFARLPEPRREWSRLHLRWQDQHSGYHIPVQRRQVQEPRGKAEDLYFTGTCKRTPGQIHKNMGPCSCACFFLNALLESPRFFKSAVKVSLSASVTRRAAETSMTIQWLPAMPWTVSWRQMRWWWTPAPCTPFLLGLISSCATLWLKVSQLGC